MTLQQLRYLIAIAEYGSINAAATRMYASQSNLSTAIRDLEQELGITIFTRSNRGVALTNDGTELLGYARQVIEQADMLEERYGGTSGVDGSPRAARLAISSQHYYFTVQAFTMTCEEFDRAGVDDGVAQAPRACDGDVHVAQALRACDKSQGQGPCAAQMPQVSDVDACAKEYDFILRECSTGQIIEDVRTFRSEVGILYIDDFNQRVLTHAFDDANVAFHPLFEAIPHVFVNAQHPLASHEILTIEDLEPYPRYSFEQGTANSFYYSEEPLSALPHKKNIRYSDRGTLTNLLTHYNGYTLSTGVLSEEMLAGIVSIPLDTDMRMQVGYIMHSERKPSYLLDKFIANLKEVIRANPTVVMD